MSDSLRVEAWATVTYRRLRQDTMFGFRNPEVARLSSRSTKRFTKHMRNKSSTFMNSVSDTLKRAGRRIPLNVPKFPAELCPSCAECVLDQSANPVHDVRLITSLRLTFDGLCALQELHIAEILSIITGLHHLEILDVRISPCFYATLAERAQFQLTSFACDSPLFDTLLNFLSTQRHLLEFTYPTCSPETQTATHLHGQEVLHTVQTLSTTSPLLLHPRLDFASLQHLEYVGGGQGLREEVRAIERIYQLGPQLQSLRFMWGGGRTSTFLDVTKFFRIATNTPSIEHIYLSGVNRDIFEQFVTMGLRCKTWRKLQTFVWVPSAPHQNDLDEPESPLSPVSPSPHFAEFSDVIKAGHPPRLRRQSTTSWHSMTSAFSSRSSLTTSTSSRRTRALSISDINRVDLSFRTHWIGKNLMATFPSLRQLVLWNWNRMGYDVLTKSATGDLVWAYRAEIDEDEWPSV